MKQRRNLLTAFGAVMALAACSSPPDTSTTSLTVASSPAPLTTVTPTADVDSSATSTSSTSPATTLAPGVGTLTPGHAGEVSVSGTLQPVSVTSQLAANGGELVSTQSWDSRFDTYGLPRIVGPNVSLVAARTSVDRDMGGWARVDELQWLFMDTTHNGIEDLLAVTALSAGLGDWQTSSEPSVVNGADCVSNTYWREASTTNWTIEGCAYPKFPGMYAVGVSRVGAFDVPPASVDPTVAAVAAALGGNIESSSAVFEHPTAAGSVVTLTTESRVAFTGDLDAAIASLQSGPLSGWSMSPGDGSVLFAGAMGTRWVIADGTATLTGTGRVSL